MKFNHVTRKKQFDSIYRVIILILGWRALSTQAVSDHKRLITHFVQVQGYCVYLHYNDVIMSAMASQITGLTIVYPTVYSGADQRKHQSSASVSFVWGIHRWPVNSPHKGPVTRKMFPFDDVIMLGEPLYNDDTLSSCDGIIRQWVTSSLP